MVHLPRTSVRIYDLDKDDKLDPMRALAPLRFSCSSALRLRSRLRSVASEPAFMGSTRVLNPRRGPTRHIGSSARGNVFVAFEGGKSAGSKVVWPSPDDVDHLLKLTRCEFGRDLVSRAGFADQQQRRRHRFGCFLFGRPFYPLRIECDAVWIGHNQNWPPVQRIGLDIAEDRVLCDPCAKAPNASSGARPRPPRSSVRLLNSCRLAPHRPSRRMTEDGSAEVIPQPRLLRGGLRRPLAGKSALPVQKLEVPHGNRTIEAIALLSCDTYVQKYEGSHHENPWLRAGEHA